MVCFKKKIEKRQSFNCDSRLPDFEVPSRFELL